MYAPTPLYLKMKAKSAEQQKLEAEVVTLRQRLEEKDQTETFIESKHSKLAEVYQALETACQVLSPQSPQSAPSVRWPVSLP
jgi:hypothetical protein